MTTTSFTRSVRRDLSWSSATERQLSWRVDRKGFG